MDSNFNFLCGRPHVAGPPVHMRPPEADPLPPPCGRHKWMAPISTRTSHVTGVSTPLVMGVNQKAPLRNSVTATVSMLECQSRVQRLKIPAREEPLFKIRFVSHPAPLTFWYDGYTVGRNMRETGHPPSHVEAKKMKSLTLDVHGLLKEHFFFYVVWLQHMLMTVDHGAFF